MLSSLISRASAGVLALGGLILLFAPDLVLAALIPGYPPTGAWLAQLLAAAWLGLASLNWISRGALLGGIYGRPVVAANAVSYFVGATSLLRAALRPGQPAALWLVAAPLALFAALYGWLLLRGPFERDVAMHTGQQRPA